MTRAVVLGGGFAGLLTAVALRDHVDEVITIERDWYSETPDPRKGVPQSKHCHLMVEGCVSAMENLLPGCIDELLSCGAKRINLTADTLIRSQMGWFKRFELGAFVISCSRALLDHVLRRKAAVKVWQGATVVRLLGGRTHVTGVLIRKSDGTTEPVTADLVVDAMGRRSNAIQWLSGLGVSAIRQSVSDSGLASSSRHYWVPAGLSGKMPAIILQPQCSTIDPGRGATLYPIENNKFVVTLTGPKSSAPPVSDAGFLDYAQSLGHGIIADLLFASVPVEPVRAYRNLTNRRRYLEHCKLPRGFLAIGDALVAVEPRNSHGMASAALGACRLQHEIAQSGLDTDLQAGVAEAAETAWQMATDPTARLGLSLAGTGEPLCSLEGRILERIEAATPLSPSLAKSFFGAQMLTAQDPSRSMLGELQTAMKVVETPLSAEEAIEQYPALATWRGQLTEVTATVEADGQARGTEAFLTAK
jgi:2-polyprenyl-6-methoxyphenol hydroxylase-like FAD-dependent oxidoreductase